MPGPGVPQQFRGFHGKVSWGLPGTVMPRYSQCKGEMLLQEKDGPDLLLDGERK